VGFFFGALGAAGFLALAGVLDLAGVFLVSFAFLVSLVSFTSLAGWGYSFSGAGRFLPASLGFASLSLLWVFFSAFSFVAWTAAASYAAFFAL
jgi:hypothetical protein